MLFQRIWNSSAVLVYGIWPLMPHAQNVQCCVRLHDTKGTGDVAPHACLDTRCPCDSHRGGHHGTQGSPGHGDVCAGYEYDLVVKVEMPAGGCPKSSLAFALAVYVEEVTNRPLFGFIEFCDLDPTDFNYDLGTAVHELIHIMVCL